MARYQSTGVLRRVEQRPIEPPTRRAYSTESADRLPGGHSSPAPRTEIETYMLKETPYRVVVVREARERWGGDGDFYCDLFDQLVVGSNLHLLRTPELHDPLKITVFLLLEQYGMTDRSSMRRLLGGLGREVSLRGKEALEAHDGGRLEESVRRIFPQLVQNAR